MLILIDIYYYKKEERVIIARLLNFNVIIAILARLIRAVHLSINLVGNSINELPS